MDLPTLMKNVPTIQFNQTCDAMRLGLPPRLILVSLMDELGEDIEGEVELGHDELAALTGYSAATVSRAISKLLKSGIISRKRHGRGGKFSYSLNADMGRAVMH